MPPLLFVVISILVIWLTIVTVQLMKSRRQTLPSPHVVQSDFRLGLVKFNPFPDTGGQQSFVISLLDGVGNGILITSLHGRGATRLYAKKITGGKADQELSAEEKQAIRESLTT